MASLRDHSPGTWPLKRSRLPALLAGTLSVEHGIFDALILNAVAGTALGAAALHLWGSALAGRVGGAVAVLLSLAMSPLVLQARMLSYYPMLNAGLALCAAGVAVAARTRSPLGLLLAGVGVGAALLSDVRGLVWALPCLGVALTIAVFAAGKPWVRVARVAALALPVALSYPLGAEVFSGATYSLEKQIDVRPLYHLHGSRAEGFRPPFSYESNYIWGHSDPLELPETLRFMVDNATVPQPDDLQMHTPQGLLASQVTPWSRAALVLVPLSFAALIRRPWALWASFGAALPYLVALRSKRHGGDVPPLPHPGAAGGRHRRRRRGGRGLAARPLGAAGPGGAAPGVGVGDRPLRGPRLRRHPQPPLPSRRLAHGVGPRPDRGVLGGPGRPQPHGPQPRLAPGVLRAGDPGGPGAPGHRVVAAGLLLRPAADGLPPAAEHGAALPPRRPPRSGRPSALITGRGPILG